jgi:aromatic-L-amino-acid decarboxylase
MAEETSYHMTPDEFRRRGRELVDWIADYQERVASLPVFPQVQPGEIRAALPAEAPAQGESFDVVLRDLEEIIMPGLTHWQSPNFYGFFPSNNSGPSILGELLSAGLSVHAMMWTTSPAATELETHVLDWLVDLLDLPAAFRSDSDGGGVIEDTASSATLCALIAARERVTDFASNDDGCDGRIVAYTSSQAHLSVEKAIKIAGLGRQNLRLIDVDDSFAMRPEHLAQRIKDDQEAGLLPAFVCATVGTTASNGLDPLHEIGRICTKANVWLHVDAAMSGTAALCPEFRHIHDGLELADSYCFNPHKWMFTNFDCDCFYVADRAALINALTILPEYLRNEATESGAVIDYRDWQVPLGRRFRALKLWFVLRHYGAEGLCFHIRQHIALAQEFASWVDMSDDFNLAVEPPLNLVCFWHRAGDEFTKQLHQRLNASGQLYLTHAMLNGRYVLRMAIGQTHTEAKHVEHAWQLMCAFASDLEAEGLE